jgi:serine O-acetyltransferase
MLADDKDWPTTVQTTSRPITLRSGLRLLPSPVLYFKGFHAIQTHRPRIGCGTRAARFRALYLQTVVLGVPDRHQSRRPDWQGIFIDHATGLVVGETAVIEDDVDPAWRDAGRYRQGRRRPSSQDPLRRLDRRRRQDSGNIEIGHCSKIAAGSVVLSPVPQTKTVAGVPARVVGETGCDQPSRQMDQRHHRRWITGQFRHLIPAFPFTAPERDAFKLNRHPALSICFSRFTPSDSTWLQMSAWLLHRH